MSEIEKIKIPYLETNNTSSTEAGTVLVGSDAELSEALKGQGGSSNANNIDPELKHFYESKFPPGEEHPPIEDLPFAQVAALKIEFEASKVDGNVPAEAATNAVVDAEEINDEELLLQWEAKLKANEEKFETDTGNARLKEKIEAQKAAIEDLKLKIAQATADRTQATADRTQATQSAQELADARKRALQLLLDD